MQQYNYRPRKHQYTSSLEAEIGGYGGEEVQEVGTPRNHRPARNLRNTEEAVIAEQLANQQRIEKARARQQALANTRQNRATNSHRVPGQRSRYAQPARNIQDDELYGDEELDTRPPRSAIRWQPEEEIYQRGNTHVYAGQVVIPKSRSASTQQPPAQPYQQERNTEGIDEEIERPRGYRRPTPPWYLLLALGAVLALTVWISGAWVNKWWTDIQNDWTYTQTFRTFSVDKVVGHNNDSASHPSHFIVQNDKRHIIIIELPADDWSKSIIYSAPTLIGDGQEKTPATISFVADAQTGRLDLVLHVQDQNYLFVNNGTKFVTPQGQ